MTDVQNQDPLQYPPSQLGGADIPDNFIPELIGARGSAADVFTPPPPGAAQLDHATVISSTLMRIEHEIRKLRRVTPQLGRQMSRPDTVNLQGGAVAGTIPFEGPRSGADWYVERVTVSVSGASAAGQVGVYQGSQGNIGIDETQLLGFLGALAGNSPSRGQLEPQTPYFLYGGQPFIVAFFGVVANSSCTARIQYREVLGQIDPLLQDQN
jgi:hypothetical protein